MRHLRQTDNGHGRNIAELRVRFFDEVEPLKLYYRQFHDIYGACGPGGGGTCTCIFRNFSTYSIDR